MNYTITSTEYVHGGYKVNFDKTGNQYLVGFTNEYTREYTHKTYDTMQEALSVYQKFVEAFITGDYSYETRKSWLS